ncbi:MAG: glycosyltransferase family 39 protein [Nodosilinea sp.]
MVTLLLPLFLVLPLGLLWLACQIQGGGGRRSILSAALLWATLLTAITELLNIFSLINQPYVLGGWLIVNLLMVFHLSRLSSLRGIAGQLKQLARDWSQTLGENPFIRFCLICLLPLLGLSLLVALVAPPNNWDSMTYHMARVMYWIQHQSVAHYPTHNLRQLDSPPWSSFAIMHLQILSGGDRFANLVQWSSMAGCLVGVSLLARQLGAGVGGQALATVICATIPMGLLQSVTSQNDYVLSFWLVCLSYNLLRLAQGQTDARTFIELGLALGLALLTKGTAYIYGLPLVVTGLFLGFQQLGARSVKPMVVTLAMPLLLNLGHWMRNYQVFGKPLGVSGDITKNTLFTPAAILSNLVRNTALHLAVPYDFANRFIVKVVYQIHSLIHLDVSDPRTTFSGLAFQIKAMDGSMPIFLSEDYSGNPITLLLVILSAGLYVFDYRRRFNHRFTLLLYSITLVAMVIAYNSLLAWQPWASRLHLPFFVLAAALMGTVLGYYTLELTRLAYGLVLILALTSLPYLVFSSHRPVFASELFITSDYSIINQPRISTYFNANPSLLLPCFKAVDTANKTNGNSIGLYLSNNDHWEYPFSRIFNFINAKKAVRFKSVGVENQSTKAFRPEWDFTPCEIFSVGFHTLGQRLTIEDKALGSIIYNKVLESAMVSVYTRENGGVPPQ